MPAKNFLNVAEAEAGWESGWTDCTLSVRQQQCQTGGFRSNGGRQISAYHPCSKSSKGACEAGSLKTTLKPDFSLITDTRLSPLTNRSPCKLDWRTLYHSEKFTCKVLGLNNPITYRTVSRIGSKFLTGQLTTF